MTRNNPRIAVIGLGFVGLPLSLTYAMKGAHVVGIDVLPEVVDAINAGHSHFIEHYQGRTLEEILREQLDSGRYRATTRYEEAAAEVANYIVTVGIPVFNGDPDLSFLRQASLDLARVLKKGDTVVVRSTVIPGATEEIVKPLLEESGLKAGEDFYLAYSSERIAEGRAFEEFINMPLALGGINEASTEKARELLTFITEAEVTISDIKVVETAKLVENIQRDVNIAMVQEFARFSEKFGIDTFELIRVANTHRRVNLLTPGPGVGGYCLPNALYYLLPKAAEVGVTLNLLQTARQINDAVPGILVEMTAEALQRAGKRSAANPRAGNTQAGQAQAGKQHAAGASGPKPDLTGNRVAVLGLAMKDFSSDARISPPVRLVELLQEAGAEVRAYDPAVPAEQPFQVASLEEAVTGADALLYVTAQEAFLDIDWDDVARRMARPAVFVDAKNRVPRRVEQYGELIRI